ncbi:MAG: hypothetical protein ACFBSC_08700 [Microcoleaceae cyanobacterium]
METLQRPKVKICCIQTIEEAWMAIQAGAAALGFVSAMPSGPGVISDALIAEIVTTVPPAIGSFLLTSLQNAEEIIAQQNYCRTNTLQLCDELPLPDYRKLRQAMPGITVVQVIHVTSEESVQMAIEVAPEVDGILLDSGNPSLPTKQLGGTGRVHNWQLSSKIRELVNVPVFLAGGLTFENVEQAIQTVVPFGVDVCSGVRTEGVLDYYKLSRFISQVNLS